MPVIRKTVAPRAFGRSLHLTALAVSLALSGCLVAVSVGAPGYTWLAWISLVPIFLAIRILRPPQALLAGSLWGISFFTFATGGLVPGVPATALSLALLAGVPACYVLLGSLLTRWIGYSPFVVGVGWIGLEFALKPLGLHHGLLAGTQGGGALVYQVGGLLGYIFVAFLVAYANALLFAIISYVRPRIPRPRLRVGWQGPRGRAVCDTSLLVSTRAILPSRARGPPARIALVA